MSETKVSIETEVPSRLWEQVQALVTAGWYRDADDVVLEALRRFLESHQAELMEEFVRQDVEWGLSGNESSG